MNVWLVMVYLVALSLLPWTLWYFARAIWMRRKERRVLVAKYGDLQMFAKRLKEWKVVR